MIVGEEEMERKVEREVWTHRGALHFEVRMSCTGCQYTHTHTPTHITLTENVAPNATPDEYGHKGKKQTEGNNGGKR